MTTTPPPADGAAYDAAAKQKSQAKTSRIPIKVVAAPTLKKPEWIRVRAGSPSTRFYEIKQILREHKLHSVCEEASCPNIGECFGKGTATFMIMGDKCTRRCPFCDVGHGRPDPLDADEPLNLAKTIAALKLQYVVITSVDRDDLRDGGAAHFVDCIRRVRELSPATRIEVLTPDFRGRLDRALDILKAAPPDVMNHNLETVPRLYKQARPGSDYAFSLDLLQRFKAAVPGVPTKSGLMVDYVASVDEARQFCRGGLPHAILFEAALAGENFRKLRNEWCLEVPALAFIEIAEDGRALEVHDIGGQRTSRIGRDVLASALPSALMFELAKAG